MALFDFSQTGKALKMNGFGAGNDKSSSEMLSAIQELRRENERLTTELGVAHESLDLFERYRSMAQEYMNMCICSSRDYLNGQYKQCESDYEQLANKNALSSLTSSGSSSTSKLFANSLSTSSSSSASSHLVVPNYNGLTIELKSGNEGKSKIRAYLDSLQKNHYSEAQEPEVAFSQFKARPNSRISKRLFPHMNGESSVLKKPKNRKLDSLANDHMKQIQQLFANRFIPQNNHINNNDNDVDNYVDEAEDELEEMDINMDSPPPPLLNRRMLFDGHHPHQEQKSESILGAMLENGCKSYTNNMNSYRPKNNQYSTSPVPNLSIIKQFDENNNSKRTHLSFEDRTSIIARLKQHEPGAKIAREYGITKQAVSAIKRRANIVVNDLSDVSLIVKKPSASSSPDMNGQSNPPTGSGKKFSRKFPKEFNILCKPYNPLDALKNQRQKVGESSDRNGSVDSNSLLNMSTSDINSYFRNSTSSDLAIGNGNDLPQESNNVSSLLLSKLLKGEVGSVDLYDSKPKSLLIHNDNQSQKEEIPSSSEDEDEEGYNDPQMFLQQGINEDDLGSEVVRPEVGEEGHEEAQEGEEEAEQEAHEGQEGEDEEGLREEENSSAVGGEDNPEGEAGSQEEEEDDDEESSSQVEENVADHLEMVPSPYNSSEQFDSSSNHYDLPSPAPSGDLNSS